MYLNVIAAVCENFGIGKNNRIPWKLKKEMEYFSHITQNTIDPNKKNAVIMGRKTWESLPEKFKPLKNRINVVISRTLDTENKDVNIVPSFEDAITLLTSSDLNACIEAIWAIGGHDVYKAAMNHPLCHCLYLTKIKAFFDCDVFFPSFNKQEFELIQDSCVPQGECIENNIRYEIEVFKRQKK